MATKTKQQQFKEELTTRIQERMEILERARIQLKQEFFGIDQVIDEVVETISSWYLFPELQEKPVIVNLWGMTGVGKTSLINRISDLIGFSKKLFWFDLGETSDRDWVIRRTLNTIFENENGYPVILCFDEFQQGRTRSQAGEDIPKPDLRVIWTLLSNGKYQMNRYMTGTDSLYYLSHELSTALERGVTVEKGILTGGVEIFEEIMEYYEKPSERINKLKRRLQRSDPRQRKRIYQTAKISFLPDNSLRDIFEASTEKFKTLAELKKYIMTLNGPESIHFLKELMETSVSLRTVDCTKAIMFVVGNLDEAYTMSLNLNPDTDPDAFHRGSMKITIPHIKKSLRKLFRSEQIARLGNTHILYPALNRDAFRKIIHKALDDLAKKIHNQVGIRAEFEESLHQLIYDEGVYPTQGARPLFTTIHLLLEAKLGKVISEALLERQPVEILRFGYQDTFLRIAFIGDNGNLLKEINEPARLILEPLRKPKMDDKQAIVAVHESGHAVLFSILLHAIPELIITVSADSENEGFTNVQVTREYRSKAEIVPSLAAHLGGYIAEKLVFGEQYITHGSESDIREATEIACEAVKKSGLGSIRGSIQIKSTLTNSQLHLDVDAEIKELLEAGEKLAEQTLREEWRLLIEMAEYLSNHRSMDKNQVEKMISRYAKTKSLTSITNDSFPLGYRKVLQTLANQFLMEPRTSLSSVLGDISLNKTNP